MLSEKQLKIANALLKHLEKNGRTNYNIYSPDLQKQGYSEIEIETLVAILEDDYKLVKTFGTNYSQIEKFFMRLTSEGYKALKMGIEQYDAEIEFDKQLDRNAKVSSIKTSKDAIRISIFALVITIFTPFIVDKCNNDPYPESHTLNFIYGNSDSYSNQYPEDFYIKVKHTQLPNKRTDSSLIEKLKDSLKHDTKFLNELKLELKRKTTDNKAPNR